MTSIINKINALNGAALDLILIVDKDDSSLYKNFTNKCIKIFEADFGFAFRKLDYSEDSKLIYKSPKAPSGSETQKNDNRLIIPIRYGDHLYGSVVLGYKKPYHLTLEELALSEIIGNIFAQTVTINWLLEKEEKDVALAEKQKETETLLAQEKLKTEFIANATHELRTPLAIMKGNIDLALMGKEDRALTRESLIAVNEEINILSDILQDLALLTSKNGAGEQLTNPRSIDLKNLLHQITKRLQTLTEEKDIKISVETTKDVMNVLGSQNHLEKLFLNLIKNAITYGKKGGNIFITAKKDKNLVRVEIADDGIGISKEDLPRIFERFFQVDKAHSSHGSHSGLGLAIAKWAADTHGGTISVKSAPGKGSTFTVTLPLASTPKTGAKRPKARQA